MLAKNELMPSIKRSCSSHQGCQPCSHSCGSGSHSVQVFFSGLDPVAEKLGAGSRLSLNTRIQKLKQEWNVSIQISQIYSSYNGLIRISIQFFLWVGSGLGFFPRGLNLDPGLLNPDLQLCQQDPQVYTFKFQ